MRQARCPVHGFGRHLVNAGAPFIVRCTSCGIVVEPCAICRGEQVAVSRLGSSSYCSCTSSPHPGWQVRPARLNIRAPIIS